MARSNSGQFKKGHKGGPGNPHAKRVGEIRTALLTAATDEAMKRVVDALIQAAGEGDVPAAKVLLDRLLGPPVPADLLARIEAVEEAQAEADANAGAA